MLIILRDQRVKAQEWSGWKQSAINKNPEHKITSNQCLHNTSSSRKIIGKNTSTVHNKNIPSKIPFWQQVNDADHVVW